MSHNVHVNITANTAGLQAGMNQAVSSVSQATSQMKIFGGGMNSLAQGPLQNFQSNLQTLPKQMDAVGNSATKTGGRLKGFGEAIKGNRGLVFGFAGLTSAMAETIGMLDMLASAEQMVAEDQAKLNLLTEKGMQNTHEYSQAQQSLLKHERFLNMSRRNTMLSIMDNIFFTTMAINGIVELASKGTKLGGVLGKIKAAFTGLNTTTKAYSTLVAGSSGLVAGTSALDLAMGRLKGSTDKANASMASLRLTSLATIGPIMAIIAAIGMAAIGAVSFAQMNQDMVKKNPDAFKKDKGGNVDMGWFGPNSLLGRGLAGESLPGEKTPLNGQAESFKNSWMGQLLNSIPGYNELGKTIENLATQTFPQLATSQEAGAETGNKAASALDSFKFAALGVGTNMKDLIPSADVFGQQIAKINGLTEEGANLLGGAFFESEKERLGLMGQEEDVLKMLIARKIEKQFADKEEKGTLEEVMAMTQNAIAIKEDQLRIDTEYATMQEEIGKMQGQRAIEVAELVAMENSYAEATGQRINLATLDFEMAQKVVQVHEEVKNAYKEEELSLQKLAEENGIMIQNLHEKTQNEIDDTNAMRDQIAAQLDWDAALNNTTRTTEMQSKANLQAKLELQQLADSIIFTNTHSEVYRQGLEQLVQTKIGLSDTSNMLTKELEYLAVNGLMNTTDKAIALTRQFEEMRDNSLDFFSDVFNADDMDDFNEAWKELDLGAIPKDMRGKFKDIFKDFKKHSEDAKEVAVGLNMVNVSMGDLTEKEVDKTLKKVFDEMEKMSKIDPELRIGMEKYPSMFADIENNAKRLPLSFAKLTEVLSDGNLTWEELNELVMLYKQEASGADASTIDLSGSTAMLNEELAKVAVTGVVVETINKMWADLAVSIMKANLVLVENWSVSLVTTAEIFANMILNMIEQWSLFTGDFNSKAVEMANKWETAMKNVAHNSKAASSQTQSEFAGLVKKLNSHFVKIANNFEKAMKNMVHNAKAAASQVNSALDKIKDKEVTLTVNKKVQTIAHGGIFEFAEGGVISAARGFTTRGPQLLLVGDNPGGRETIAAIPHDSPGRTMSELNNKFGKGGEGKAIIINLTPTIVIGQDKLTFTQRYRLQQGESVANQV